MSARPLPVTVILVAGVGIGLAGDALLRAPGGPGLNVTFLFAGLAASVVLVSWRGGPRLSVESGIGLALGVLFGGALSWRGSDLLGLMAFFAASMAFTLPAFRAGRAWVLRASASNLCEAVLGSGLYSFFGSIGVLQKARREARAPETGTRPGSRSAAGARSLARTALVGSLLAAVPLVVFGALFMSADRVFAQAVTDRVRLEPEAIASHVALATTLSWLACGYLVGFSSGTRLDPVRELGWPRPSLRTGEAAVALGLVDLLFLAFVTVQLRYLFGGHELVEVTPGLTYAAYAREGFFELVVATALGLPWLLAVDAFLGDRGPRGRRVFRALAGAQLLLLLVVVVSAVERMRAYLDAYGLTEDRFVALAILGWSALLVVWFAATILRDRRSSFAFGALVSGFGLVAVLQIANPAALSAKSHLDRVAQTSSADPDGSSPGLDARYLASLGSDAAPRLVERIYELDSAGRCLVARSLLGNWGPDSERDWRSWTYADWQARKAVSAHVRGLRSIVGDDETCDPGVDATDAGSAGTFPGDSG